ncbi:MAG: cobyric acid synthase [Dehalococcoidia bacterium]
MSPIGSVIMIQGTSSSAGKSFLVAGLCRLLTQEGLRVAPFKAQNMSNNAFVTVEGHEIGRAQATQAQAARVRPHVDMNPVLLKPEADQRSQVIVMGRPFATLHAAAYQEVKEQVWHEVLGALGRLRASYDVVVIEGAGSPAEINLKARDISNMRVAKAVRAPVLVVGDIDRGGVFAHLYGTYHLLDPDEQALVRGFIINRLRGDPSLLEPGLRDIERLTGVPVVGVVPWIHDHGLPEEDAVALERRPPASAGPFPGIDIAVIRLPRIANFDDFDPLEVEPDVRLRYVTSPAELEGADVVILPGTNATIADMAWLRQRRFESAIGAAAAPGAAVIGICGGLQMLGERIDDPEGIESQEPSVTGLGLLPVTTRFRLEKTTRQSVVSLSAWPGLLEGLPLTSLTGYEIHAGQTEIPPGQAVAWLEQGGPIGVTDEGGWTFACYLHGLFANDALRQRVLENIARRRGKRFTPRVLPPGDPFDRVADVLRSSLNLPAIFALLEQGSGQWAR